MARKPQERLADWDQRLFEMRALLFNTAGEFDDWCRTASANEVCGSALSNAAKFFHLDEKKPDHKKLLLFILADALFGRRVGRPKKASRWDHYAYLQLHRHYAEVTNGRLLSDQEAAAKIKDRFRDYYRHTQVAVLRKRLPEARRLPILPVL